MRDPVFDIDRHVLKRGLLSRALCWVQWRVLRRAKVWKGLEWSARRSTTITALKWRDGTLEIVDIRHGQIEDFRSLNFNQVHILERDPPEGFFNEAAELDETALNEIMGDLPFKPSPSKRHRISLIEWGKLNGGKR